MQLKYDIICIFYSFHLSQFFNLPQFSFLMFIFWLINATSPLGLTLCSVYTTHQYQVTGVKLLKLVLFGVCNTNWLPTVWPLMTGRWLLPFPTWITTMVELDSLTTSPWSLASTTIVNFSATLIQANGEFHINRLKEE